MNRLFAVVLFCATVVLSLNSLVIAQEATPVTGEATAPAGSASVVIKLFDSLTSAIVNGACFSSAVLQEPGRVELLDVLACDPDDGADDGYTTLQGIPAGQEVTVYSTSLPVELYRLPISQITQAEAGETAELFMATGTVCVYERPDLGCATVTIKEPAGIAPEEPVCYAIFLLENGAPGAFFTTACDSPSGSDPRTSVVVFNNVRDGTYQIMRIEPDGKPIGDPIPLTVFEGEDVLIDWPAG